MKNVNFEPQRRVRFSLDELEAKLVGLRENLNISDATPFASEEARPHQIDQADTSLDAQLDADFEDWDYAHLEYELYAKLYCVMFFEGKTPSAHDFLYKLAELGIEHRVILQPNVVYGRELTPAEVEQGWKKLNDQQYVEMALDIMKQQVQMAGLV